MVKVASVPKLPPLFDGKESDEELLEKVVLTAHEVELVLMQPDVNDPLGVRARAILETLYSTGMRRMELVALGVYDVDWQRETAHIRSGKGKKERIVPIGGRALLWIRRYLDDVRPLLLAGRSEPALFLTINGEPMRRQTVSDLVTKCIEAAGINKTGSAHVLRHTAATLMLENGADVRFIQAMLGHEKLSSTEIYTKVSIEKLNEVHAATHRARLVPPSTSE